MPRGVYDRSKAAKAEGEVPDEEGTPPAAAPDATAASDTQPATTAATDEPALCPAHFPEGWPAGVTSAGCIHGQWERALPADEADAGA